MTASELVAQLERLISDHGDLPVWQTVDAGIASVGSVEFEDDSRCPFDGVTTYFLISEVVD